MSYCGERTIVKRVDRRLDLASLRCRSWTCPDCADTRKDGLIAQAIGGAPSTFLTLTIRRSRCPTPNDAAKALVRAWRLLRLRIMRRYGWKKLPFLAVFEPHQSGWPHLHILLRSGFIDINFLRDVMSELLDSPQVHIQHIQQKTRVAGYCAKYVGKGTAKFGSSRRYWMSQDYDLRPKWQKRFAIKGCPFTEVVPSSITKLIAVYEHQGWTCERHSGFRVSLHRPKRQQAREGPP